MYRASFKKKLMNAIKINIIQKFNVKILYSKIYKLN